MKTQEKFKSDWGYQFLAPPHWQLQDGKTNSIVDPESGVGALQISTFEIPSDQTVDIMDELLDFVSESKAFNPNEKGQHKNQVVRSNNTAMIELEGRDFRFHIFWIIFKRPRLLFATYNCKYKDKDIEQEIVKGIASSIEIL